MTDHRPECPWPDKPCGPDHEPMHDREPMFCVACLTECICGPLRACEQRVIATIRRDSWFEDGWNQALDAAREAVAALPCAAGRGQDRKPRHVDDFKDSALAAIDALREKP